MVKDLLVKLLDKPIKIFNDMQINKYYSNIDIKADEIYGEDFTGKNVLILMPHVDDETMAIGGLISELAKVDCKTYLLYSTNSEVWEDGVEKDIRIQEARDLCEIFNIDKLDYVDIKNHTDGIYTSENMDYMRDELYKKIYDFKPDYIFTCYLYDNHKDHYITTLVLRDIFKEIDLDFTIFLTELSNLLPNKVINCYYSLSKENLKDKERMYSLFQSQDNMQFDIFQRLNIGKAKAVDKDLIGVEFFARMTKEDYIEFNQGYTYEEINKILPYRLGSHFSFYKVILEEKERQDLFNKILK